MTSKHDDGGKGFTAYLGWALVVVTTMSVATNDGETGAPALTGRGVDRLERARTAGVRLLTPTVVAAIALVAMTGVAAAQDGGLCGTPAVDLFEWAISIGSELLFLGGLLVGAISLAISGLVRNPQLARVLRQKGTMALIAGPIFSIAILLGEQAAAAAGFEVAQCADVTPW